MTPTTVSIWRAAAEELLVRFETREAAYNWAIRFMQRWGNNIQYSPYEKNDSCMWGSPVANDSYFDIFIFDGHGEYDRNSEWYLERDIGFSIVSESEALRIGPHNSLKE